MRFITYIQIQYLVIDVYSFYILWLLAGILQYQITYRINIIQAVIFFGLFLLSLE